MNTNFMHLPVESEFSKAVYKVLRPAIPRSAWPTEALRGSFTPTGDGMMLISSFDGLPPSYAQLAARVVAQSKVELVVTSPAARLAGSVVRAKRWRDTFLFGAVPLLFAVPFLGSLSEGFMRLAMGAFAADMAALVLAHAVLMRRRGWLLDARFTADIPVPGLRVRVKPVSHGAVD